MRITATDLILNDDVSRKEVDMVVNFLNNASIKFNMELDMELINTYFNKIVELDGTVNLLVNYIEAFQYFLAFEYDDNVLFDKDRILKANDISEYERIYNVTGKGKYIIDLFNEGRYNSP